MLPPLITERLSFRPFEDSDFANMRALDTDPEVVKYLSHGKVREPSETQENLKKIAADYEKYGIGLYVTEKKDTGEFVGRTGLIPWDFEGEVLWEVGYSLSKKYWGQGLATEAASFWSKLGMKILPVPYLVSLIHPDNLHSVRVAEKIGMRFWKKIEFKGHPLHMFQMPK